MIRACALLVLLCAAPAAQDELLQKIDAIIPRLSDDAIEVRDKAVQDLSDLGPAALPLLKKRAAELGVETRGRLLEACGRIESRNTLAKYLPPLRKITLDWDNKPVREALDQISRLSGLAVDASNANVDAATTFTLKDASPLEAFDEVCRRSGLTWRAVDDENNFGMRRRGNAPARTGPRIMVQNGKLIEYPSVFVRHYRVRVTQVSLTRTNNFQVNQSNAQISLDLGFGPDVKPDGLQSFKITDMKDDQGRSLLQEDNDRNRARFRNQSRRYRGREMNGYSQYLQFKFPEADAKKIAVLKGSAQFTYPQETKTLSFEKLAESIGKSIELSGLTVTLKDYQEKGTGHSLTLEMTGRYQGPREADAGDEDDSNNLPFTYEDVELVTENGDPLRHQGMSGSGDGKTYTWQLDFDGGKAAAAKEIRIHCVLRRFQDEIEFEIKDIALPK